MIKSIVILPGAYEIDGIAKYIQRQIIDSGNGRVFGEENNERLWEKTFFLKANNSTMKCEIRCIYLIFFSAEKSIGRLLGYSPDLYKRKITHESNLPVDISKMRIISVECNITSGAYSNDQEAHTLFEFDIDVEPRYKLTKEPKNIIYMPVNLYNYIDNITLRIVNEENQLIDFEGVQIVITLELKK